MRIALQSRTERVLYFVMIVFNSLAVLLGALLVVACFVNPARMGGSRAPLYGAVLAVPVAGAIYWIGRSLNSVVSFTVAADGSWSLRAAGGWSRGSLAPGPRELTLRTRKFLLAPNPYMIRETTVTRGWIGAGGRRYLTVGAPPMRWRSVLERLGSGIQIPPAGAGAQTFPLA